MSPRVLSPGAYFPFDENRKDLLGLFANDSGVDVSTLRKYGAKFGRGVAVELGITNPFTKTQFDTLLGGYNATDLHRPQDVTNQFDGWRRVPKVSANGNTNTEVFVNVSPASTSLERYSFNCLFRSDGTPTFSSLSFFNTGGPNNNGIPVTTRNLGGGVFQLAGTAVLGSGVTNTRVSIFITWGTATYLEVQDWMFFPHAGVHDTVTEVIFSSGVYGARANGVLKYPGHLLPRDKGTVSCWIRPNYDFKNFATADYRGIVTSTITHLSDQFQLWIYGVAGANLVFETWQGAVQRTTLSYATLNWSPTRLHHVACTWSDVERVLYYDGVRRATASGAFNRWNEATWVTIGTASTPATANDFAESLIDDLAILPRQLTDAQIAALFALKNPFVGEAGLAAAGLI